MLHRHSHHPTAYDDDREGQPAQSWFHQYVLGVALPLGLGIYGGRAALANEVVFTARGVGVTLHGSNAIAFGIAWLSAAVFVHCHYFWGNIFDQAWFAVLGKIISACGFIGGLGFVLIRAGVLGRI